MKSRIFTVAVILSATFCWQISWSIENPGVGNPVGPSTIPPSIFQSGLVSNPSPIDTSSNLLITGNVRRGRHFRGDVPYRSATSFGSSLGSSSLSSFLRDTAGSEDLRTYSNKYGTQPYYSPAETVTTMMPGRSGIFMPESARMSTRVQQNTRSAETDVSGLEFQPKGQALFGQGVTAADSDLQRPASQYGPLAQTRLMLESKFPTNMSPNPRNIEQLMPAQLGIHQQDESSAVELFKEQVQDVTGRTQSTGWPGRDSTTVPGPQRQEGLWEKDGSFKFSSQETNIENSRPKFNWQALRQTQDGKQTTVTHQGISAASREFRRDQEKISKGDQEQGDVLERIRQQLEDLTKSLDAAMQSRGLLTEKRDGYQDLSTDSAAKQEEMPLGQQRYIPDSRQAVPRERINSGGDLNSYQPRRAELSFNGEEPAPAAGGEYNRLADGEQTGLEFTGISNYATSQKRSSSLQQLNKLSQAEISAEANRIMGPHGSLESLSESKFNQHMHEAEEHLKAGRYYRAAGCFSLASVYQSDNPLALAGRGHALFAVGEYVGSALFLSRVLAVNPEYLLVKVDLVAMLGDENKLAGRIADIEQWLARSGSSQLQFLLGYVYYRTGQLLRAKQAVDAAYEKTPKSPAVRVMKITIDNMMIRQ
ncbi:MAG: tetratricopeptide repeat protein [Planctomycetota bacterium]